MRSIPASKEAEKPSLAGLIDGIRYAFSRQDLLGTYLVDLAAMFFAMPTALIPFWADELGTPWALGLMYAVGTVGSIIITLTSGWTKNYRFHGRAIICVIVVALLAGFMSKLGKFDAQTNEFALQKLRENESKETE